MIRMTDIRILPPPGIFPRDTPGWTILHEISRKHDLNWRRLIDQDRRAKIVAARDEAIARIRTELKWSLSRIGTFMGHRHHTTIWHSLTKQDVC
mgnify:FL=1